MRSKRIPEAPEKGLPSLSSLKPGASPTMNNPAFSGPSPKMTSVLDWHSPHFVQPKASFWASAKSKRLELLALRKYGAEQPAIPLRPLDVQGLKPPRPQRGRYVLCAILHDQHRDLPQQDGGQ